MKNELLSKIMSNWTYGSAGAIDQSKPHLRIHLRSKLRVEVKNRTTK